MVFAFGVTNAGGHLSYLGTRYMNVKIFVWLSLFFACEVVAAPGKEQNVEFQINIPILDVDVYHRPFIAVWVQSELTKEKIPVAVWYDDAEWLKDLRQWWRRIGRASSPSYDHVTGATKKPGSYRLFWNGLNSDGVPMPPGIYWVYVESAREEGDRELLRRKFEYGSDKNVQLVEKGRYELGDLHITIEVKGEKE